MCLVFRDFKGSFLSVQSDVRVLGRVIYMCHITTMLYYWP